ncbi:MAG: hypothetical protein IKH61_12770 [Bacteroidales bacterium]|nr:hypothetical protein [Bacteroidales bacterium]
MIQLYRAGHTAFKLDSRNPLNLRCVTKAQLERKAMEQDAVAITLLCVAPCEFEYRDYIIVDGRPYFLNVLPKVTKEDRRRFQYELTFESGIYEVGRVFYTMTDLHGWDYTGQLFDFCNLVINDMNRNSLVIKDSDNRVLRYSGRRIGGLYYWYNVNTSDTMSYFTTRLIPLVGDDVMPGEWSPGDEGYPRVTQVGGAWTLDFELDNGKPVETDEKMLTYDNHTCLAVLHDLVSQWGDWEFAVDIRTSDLCTLDLTSDIQCGGTLIMRRKSTGIFISGVNTNHLNMSYGKKGGLQKITREYPEGTNIPSRIYFYGGTKNLPYSYRNTRLCLPTKSKMESYIDLDVAENIPCEVVKVFDDIYPACKPFSLAVNGCMKPNDDTKFIITVYMTQFFNLYAHWHDPDDPTPYNYGSYAEWVLMHGTDNAQTNRERYLLYYYQGDLQAQVAGYPKSCYLTTDRVTITFQTGNLAGRSFEVVDFETFNEDNEYQITLACEGTKSPFEDDIQYFPNNDVMCKLGDKFIIEGCLMPASYVYGNFGSGEYAAETLLETEAKKYIEELSSKISVAVEISQDFVNQHNAVFRLYDGLQITDTDLDFSSLTFKVRSLIYDLLANSYKVEIDDGKGMNPWAAISQYLDRIRPIK